MSMWVPAVSQPKETSEREPGPQCKSSFQEVHPGWAVKGDTAPSGDRKGPRWDIKFGGRPGPSTLPCPPFYEPALPTEGGTRHPGRGQRAKGGDRVVCKGASAGGCLTWTSGQLSGCTSCKVVIQRVPPVTSYPGPVGVVKDLRKEAQSSRGWRNKCGNPAVVGSHPERGTGAV